ncbi:MAG: VOC family protein [Candidatus Zixiibacteriota bacterium]
MNGICHIEIPCKNLDTVSEFYSEIFDWKIMPMPGMEYSIYQPPSGPGGGFSTNAKISEKAGVLLFIEVEDIPATLKKIGAKGGKETCPKTMISPEHGFFATFSDTEGNAIGLWSKN